MGFRVALLGGLAIATDDGDFVPTNLGRRECAVVTLLALNGGHTVTVARLVDELWPEHAPDSAENTVQVYISRIRRALGPQSIQRTGAGYALNVAADDVDVNRFIHLAEQASRALRAGQFEDASELAQQATHLWERGALLDGADLPSVQGETVRLDELRLSTIEDGVEAELALGRGHLRIAELQTLVEEHPFRERLEAALMTALFQGGRQADALACYSDYRRRCIDELGIEPGASVQALQVSMLAGGDTVTDA